MTDVVAAELDDVLANARVDGPVDAARLPRRRVLGLLSA